jgi:nucleoside 2-deoxyribosyltransferase
VCLERLAWGWAMDAEKRISTIDSLKEIVVFLAALTFTNAISTLLLDDFSKRVRPWGSVKMEDWLCFIFLIFGLIRFYHGNFRLLDDSYKIGIQKGGIVHASRQNVIWFDFISVLAVALVFCLLSFFIREFSYFVCIYIAIIMIDIVWLYFTNKDVIIRRSPRGFTLQTGGFSWFYNNVAFLGLLALFIVAGYGATAAFEDRESLESVNRAITLMKFEDVRWLFWGITLLIIFNSLIDFWYNWSLYFPGTGRKISGFPLPGEAVKRLFLAAPFTQLLQSTGPTAALGNYRHILEGVIELFDANNIEVFSAHKREEWGEKLEQPAKALNYDLDEISRSDLVVAIIGAPPSPGVQLEIGYAIALKKPIVLLLKKNEFVPYLTRGLGALIPTKEIWYDHDSQIAQILKIELSLQ